MSVSRNRVKVIRRPNVPEPNPVLLFCLRCVVACGISACALVGMANAEETAPLDIPGTAAAGGGDDENPGLGVIGRVYKYFYLNYSEFQLAWIGSFVLHEAAYFGAYIPWIIVDAIPYCRRYKIQVTEDNAWPKQWKCLKQLLFAHVFIQFPMMALFHVAAIDFGGMRMDLKLPSVTTLAWQIPVFFACVALVGYR